MFKILLVDDEPNVRQGIKMMIPWEELGCEVVGEADDGDDGLSKIMLLSPDIVIADIKMPGKTGIEMTEAAKALGFKGKVLILSGYSDFTYAKTAIALGVENFILKPVDEDELIDAIKAAGEKITREREHRYRQEIGKEYLNEQLVKGLFSGSSDAVITVMNKYEYPGYCAAVVCSRSSSEADNKEVRRFFGNSGNVDIVSVDLSGTPGILFKGWSRADIKAALTKLYTTYKDRFYIACGEYVLSPAQIKTSYDCAEYIVRCRFIYDHLGIVFPENIRRTSPEDTADYADRIFAYMEINDKEKLGHLLDSFCESMQFDGNTPERAKVICLTMVMEVKTRLSRGSAEKRAECDISDEFIDSLQSAESLKEAVDSIKEELGEISDRAFGKTTKSTMERVVQYIKANYNRELRLEILAGIFGYNSAYLGKVFHQYTGENFNNYLDRIRITEAKRLLSMEEYKVYEVAEMVGYTNINYFHNKFKKYTGMSPLVFKKNGGSEE